MVLTRTLGASVKRKEDPRLITGSGTYVDDVKLLGMLHVAFVRSPYAKARITRIDTSAARSMPGVVAVLTGDDVASGPPLPVVGRLPGMKETAHYPLTSGVVHHVGEPVAAVAADDPYRARDAAAAVEIEWEPLESVTDPERALAADAPHVHDQFGDNVCFTTVAEKGDHEAAFAAADVVVKQRLVNQRLSAISMEPRGLAADYQKSTGMLTVWYSTQSAHLSRMYLARTLGIPETKIRVIAPDVGGGFGVKVGIYPDELLTVMLAIKLGRPVKWVETRSEHLLSTGHGRDQIAYVEAAATKDGVVTAMRWKVIADLGAYTEFLTAAIPTLTPPMMVGTYAIKNVRCEVVGVFTNKLATTAYRGAGRPEAAYYVERVMDLVADATGVDPAEVRRRNFIPPEAFPYQTPIGFEYDSGEYAKALDKALELVDYQGLRREQAEARKQGRLLGIGVATFVEVCGFGPSAGSEYGGWEQTTVRVERDGKVSILTGASPHGQGVGTALAQVVADELGIPIDDIEVFHGDTAIVTNGVGTFGSRSAALAGSAGKLAAETVRDKAVKIAAFLLEAAPQDIEISDDKYSVKGAPQRGVTFAEIAHAAYSFAKLPAKEFEPGLEATKFFEPQGLLFPFGAHVAVVEVDPDSGRTTILRYLTVDDCGRVLNPMLAEGQVHGGLAQGIAQALYEEVVYDESGQLITGSLLDYAVPTAAMLPPYENHHTVTLTPHNPLGVKGIGEAATIGSTPTIANAVVDAISHLGITHLDMPLKPERVWRAIQSASR